jgi:dihydroxyacetone kinase-like protein
MGNGMSQQITLAHIRRWLSDYCERIQSQEHYLTELDAAIGDADHGANMRRGTRQLSERMAQEDSPVDTISAFLHAAGMTLISSIGGAAGPLYGAFFLRAAQATREQETLSVKALASMFRAGLEGVKERGRAQVGDKTLVDTLQPAVEALEAAAQEGLSLEDALKAARTAAEVGMHKTIEMQANRGRASYLGPRALEHQDPGATSLYFLVESAARMLTKQPFASHLETQRTRYAHPRRCN